MQHGIDISKFHTDQNISSVCPKRIFFVFSRILYIFIRIVLSLMWKEVQMYLVASFSEIINHEYY